MAKQSGLGQQFYMHGYDLSGDVGSLSGVSSPRGSMDVTAINKSAFERVLTRTDGKLTFSVFFNTAAGQEHEKLSTLPTADQIVTWLFSSTAGDVAAGLVAKQIGYNWSRPADGSLLGTVECEGQGAPLEWGKSLTAGKVTHASAGSSASVDDGAGSSNGLAGYLQFFSRASGTPTFLVEHSADNAIWATLLTFDTTGGATPFGERKTVSGTVNRYLRATTTGVFTDAVFALVYRRGTAQDDAGVAY
jgi:hypothetical protein